MIVVVERKGEALFVGEPECIVHQRPLLREIPGQLFARVFLAHEMREIRERAQCFDAEAGLIQLGFHGEQRATFDPAVADALIFREAMLVVSGAEKFVGFPEAVPLFFGESRIAARVDVIVHRNEVERRGVGGGVGIRIALEPVHEICALGNFVGDFTVFALEFADERERGARSGKVTGGVKRERGPKRIAAEKPGESGALAGSGSAVAGDKASAKKWIGNKSLEFANARPIVGLLDLRVGKIERDGAGEIVLIIL